MSAVTVLVEIKAKDSQQAGDDLQAGTAGTAAATSCPSCAFGQDDPVGACLQLEREDDGP
jgi:hypothetical protein